MFGSFLPSLLVGSHHQSLLGPGSRHCYGINYTQNASPRANHLANLFTKIPIAACPATRAGGPRSESNPTPTPAAVIMGGVCVTFPFLSPARTHALANVRHPTHRRMVSRIANPRYLLGQDECDARCRHCLCGFAIDRRIRVLAYAALCHYPRQTPAGIGGRAF